MQTSRMELIIWMNILMFLTLHQWQIIRKVMNHTNQKITLDLLIGSKISQCTVQLCNSHSQNKDSAWNQWEGLFNNLPNLIKLKMIINSMIMVKTKKWLNYLINMLILVLRILKCLHQVFFQPVKKIRIIWIVSLVLTLNYLIKMQHNS